tara:strand:+ start:126 stop:521 length:396 start_codon:yes stop_codon:yes gene_type:complete
MNPYLIQVIELTPLLINVSGHRIPYPQAGYVDGFIPFEEGEPKGEMEIFSDGFIGREVISDMEESEHRPMGLAQRQDGSLYISESKKGKMWRIIFNGSKEIFSDQNLLSMKDRKLNRSNIKQPEEVLDMIN